MPLLYNVAADVVVLIHMAYVLFVVVGLPLVWIGGWRGWLWVRNPWFRSIHLAMIGIVVIESWFGIVCPLTTLENFLRRAAGEEGISDGFVARWVHKALFFDVPPPVFTILYTAFGLAVAASFWFVPPRRASRRT